MSLSIPKPLSPNLNMRQHPEALNVDGCLQSFKTPIAPGSPSEARTEVCFSHSQTPQPAKYAM